MTDNFSRETSEDASNIQTPVSYNYNHTPGEDLREKKNQLKQIMTPPKKNLFLGELFLIAGILPLLLGLYDGLSDRMLSKVLLGSFFILRGLTHLIPESRHTLRTTIHLLTIPLILLAMFVSMYLLWHDLAFI